MPVQTRALATRQNLIDEAVRLFVENGYENTTPKEISLAADLTAGAFYYHFKSKEHLAAAIIDEGWPKLAQTLDRHLGTPRSGLQSLTNAVFATLDIVNRDKMQWIGFHLDMAIAHLGPEARKAYRKRVEIFTQLIADALPDSEIRAGITAHDAGELLWMAVLGAQLMSDALEQTGPALFSRIGTAWKSALRTIVPDETWPHYEQLVNQTVSRYGPTASNEAAMTPLPPTTQHFSAIAV